MTRRVIAIAVAVVLLCSLAGCGTDPDGYYKRDPYRDGKVIDRGLASTERTFVLLLRGGASDTILSLMTAPPYESRMRHFLDGYAGHPTTVVRAEPGDDATAEQFLSVSCPGGVAQRVGLAWAWFDEAWRAWPHYRLDKAGNPSEPGGCA